MITARVGFVLILAALIASCGGYSSSPSSPSPTPTPTPAPAPSPAPASPATIAIPPNARTLGPAAYSPNPATVTAGATITWSNTDSTTHDMVADGGAFDSGRVGPNGTFSFAFAQRGTYSYHCSIHPSMTGTIVVQ